MTMRRWFGAAVLALAGFLPGLSSAAGVDYGQEPPASVIVDHGGLEWIWAGPCSRGGDSCGVSTELFGFHDPSQTEWALWSDRGELITAFTGKCGSPWLSPFHNHCDQDDLVNGHIWHAFANDICSPPYFNGCEAGTTETFFVRDHIGTVAEPQALALSLAGIAMIGWARRRRQLALAA